MKFVSFLHHDLQKEKEREKVKKKLKDWKLNSLV